jgi:hypothetical protein
MPAITDTLRKLNQFNPWHEGKYLRLKLYRSTPTHVLAVI